MSDATPDLDRALLMDAITRRIAVIPDPSSLTPRRWRCVIDVVSSSQMTQVRHSPSAATQDMHLSSFVLTDKSGPASPLPQSLLVRASEA